MILALETSGELGSVACLREGRVCGAREFNSRQDACRRLPPLVRDLLESRILSRAELRGLAVSLGPGSFNGLRVGVAFAKALAHALSLPVVGISTPEAWAYESAARHPEAAIAVLQPVRREFLYLTVFAPGATELLAPTALVEEATWRDLAAAHAQRQPLLLTGDWPGLAALSELSPPWQLDTGRRPSPSAGTIALLALPLLASATPASAFTLRPQYLSPSQAERVRGVDLGL